MVPGLNVGIIRVQDIWSGEEEARLAVTVIRPRVVDRCGDWIREKVSLAPGETRSLFLRVPPAATQLRVEARETAREGDSRIAFRTLGIRPREESGALAAPVEAGPGGISILHRSVREGTTLEVVVSRPFRTAPEASEVELALCFRGLASGTEDLVLSHSRTSTHLPLRAGGDVRGRLEAFVEWEAEPLALAWKSTKDPDGPLLLGEETIFLHEGTATFDVPANRPEIRFLTRYETPFEDYLDDAVWLVRDPNGRVRQKGLVRFGAFTFKPPHRGRFELVVRNWERGRRFHRDGGVLSVLLLRKVRRQNLKLRHDLYEGIVPGGPSGNRYILPDGSFSSVLVERPKGSARYVGTLRFRDEEWNVPLLEKRVHVEPAPAAPGPGTLRGGILGWLSAEVRHALDRDLVPDATAKEIERWAAAAEAAALLGPKETAALELYRVRLSGRDPKEALAKLDALVETTKEKGGENHQAAVRARIEVAVLAGELEKARGWLGQVRGDDEGARRARYVVEKAAGNAKAALGHLDKLLKSAPPSPSLYRERFELLVANGRKLEARRLLSAWTEHFPGREEDRTTLAALLD
jgi:hypothetical protein